jgi:endo-1,4-beta-xylanase
MIGNKVSTVITRRQAFKLIAAAAVAGGAQPWSSPALAADTAAALSLGQIAQQKGLLYGSTVGKGFLVQDSGYADLVARQCKIVVPETEMKWKALRPRPDSFVFDNADWILNWAQSRGIPVRGTALVWHEALPSWFESYANQGNARDLLVNHIRTVLHHYAGKIHSWDVVNEGLTERGYRDTPWLRLLGPEYMDIAFQTAAEADPKAIRTYNDMYVEEANNDAKRVEVLKLLKQLLAKNVPVQALGIQAHLRWDMGQFDARKVRDFLRQVSDLGLQVFISELDLREHDSDKELSARDRSIADFYYDFLSGILEDKSIKVVISWGLTDRYTWLTNQAPRSDRQPVRPLIFSDKLERKPAFDAFKNAFEHMAAR